MYRRISVLQDTYWNTIENVLKIQKKCSVTLSDTSTKGMGPQIRTTDNIQSPPLRITLRGYSLDTRTKAVSGRLHLGSVDPRGRVSPAPHRQPPSST